jgi:hypothetical protein
MRRLGAKATVELLDPHEDVAHVRNGVDAEIGAGAVRSAALRLDLEADEALVGEREPHLGGLGDDGRVRAVALRHPCRADAGDLFVADGRDDDVARQPGPRRVRSGEHDRCEARLHVVGAAPVQAAVLDRGLEGPVHARDADRVHVRVQEQGLSAPGAPRDPDGVETSRRHLFHVDVEARPLQPPGHEARDLPLPGRALDQVGVDRIDANEVREQVGEHRDGGSY